MTAVIVMWIVSMLICGGVIYWLASELKWTLDALDESESRRHYAEGRNAWFCTELDKRTTKTVSTSRLPADHPQRRKPKAIRGKRK